DIQLDHDFSNNSTQRLATQGNHLETIPTASRGGLFDACEFDSMTHGIFGVLRLGNRQHVALPARPMDPRIPALQLKKHSDSARPSVLVKSQLQLVIQS